MVGDELSPGPSDPPPVEPQRELLHTTEQTRTYPCTACGGELEFDIAKQRLVCPHCGNEQTISTKGMSQPKEKSYRETVEALKSGAIKRQKRQVDNQHEVVCQNCGGHTTFTGSLTATRCPYCATPIQRDDVHEAPTRLAVDGVLPFKVDPKAAKENIEKWISSRWFAPNDFKKYNSKGSFASVYTAYFTYDADTRTMYRGERGDNYTVTVGSGDNRRTETRIRWRPASGTVQLAFDDVAISANTGLDRDKVAKLEPWPTAKAKPFTPEYIAGHLSRTYDRDVEACFPDAKSIMDDDIERAVKRDIGGDHQRIHNKNTNYGNLGFKHLLLPIWLLTVMYAGEPFQVFINGVTGEVQGQRPYSKIKIAIAVVLAITVAVLAYLWINST